MENSNKKNLLAVIPQDPAENIYELIDDTKIFCDVLSNFYKELIIMLKSSQKNKKISSTKLYMLYIKFKEIQHKAQNIFNELVRSDDFENIETKLMEAKNNLEQCKSHFAEIEKKYPFDDHEAIKNDNIWHIVSPRGILNAGVLTEKVNELATSTSTLKNSLETLTQKNKNSRIDDVPDECWGGFKKPKNMSSLQNCFDNKNPAHERPHSRQVHKKN